MTTSICETLECRTLLSAVHAGSEFQINTFTKNRQFEPDLAIAANGNGIVVWTNDDNKSGSAARITGRRVGPSGLAGGEIMISQDTSRAKGSPAVAMLPNGDFIATWEFDASKQAGWDIRARRFDAVGQPLGNEFQVNQVTANSQWNPDIAADAQGNFIITWSSYGQNGAAWDIYARRFNAQGVALGGEFRVNQPGAEVRNSSLNRSSVAMHPDGQFVVAWEARHNSSSPFQVFLRQFNAAATPVGPHFTVTETTTHAQHQGVVAAAPGGEFLVAWSDSRVHARQFDSAGAPKGDAFLVGSTFADMQAQFDPAVAVAADGSFAVAWGHLPSLFDTQDIYARNFDAAGEALSDEFRVNTYLPKQQSKPKLATDDNARTLIVWQSDGQDDSSLGVFGRHYQMAVVDARQATGANAGTTTLAVNRDDEVLNQLLDLL